MDTVFENRTKDLDFSGKRVLITGAASGIGAEMAKLLVSMELP